MLLCRTKGCEVAFGHPAPPLSAICTQQPPHSFTPQFFRQHSGTGISCPKNVFQNAHILALVGNNVGGSSHSLPFGIFHIPCMTDRSYGTTIFVLRVVPATLVVKAVPDPPPFWQNHFHHYMLCCSSEGWAQELYVHVRAITMDGTNAIVRVTFALARDAHGEEYQFHMITTSGNLALPRCWLVGSGCVWIGSVLCHVYTTHPKITGGLLSTAPLSTPAYPQP